MPVFDKLGLPYLQLPPGGRAKGLSGNFVFLGPCSGNFARGRYMFGRRTGISAAVLLLLPVMIAVGGSIPKDQIDASQIYYGSPSSFENAAEVDIETVVAATPEYQEIVKNKIDKGTGKYWILKSEASNRALKAVSEVADKTDYDLIAEKGYLKKLDPPIACKDITELVVSKL